MPGYFRGSFILVVQTNSLASGVTAPYNIFYLLNPAASRRVFKVRHILFKYNGGDVAGTSAPGAATSMGTFALYRATGISGGVDVSSAIAPLNRVLSDSTATAARRTVSGDTAISATVGTLLRAGNMQTVGWMGSMDMFEEIRSRNDRDFVRLDEGHGILLRIENQLLLGTTHWIATLEWEEWMKWSED